MSSTTAVPEVFHFVDTFEMRFDAAKQLLAAAQDRQKSCADQKHRDVPFAVGEQVVLSTEDPKLRTPAADARKLVPKFVGPFKVLQQINPVAYELELPGT